MIEIKLPSGAKLGITPLPFGDAWFVCQIIARVFEKIQIDLQTIDWKDFQPIELLTNFKSPFCSLLANAEVIEAAKKCFQKCLYNGLRIDDSTFEEKVARSDFLPVVFYVLKENISPFFENLLSFLTK